MTAKNNDSVKSSFGCRGPDLERGEEAQVLGLRTNVLRRWLGLLSLGLLFAGYASVPEDYPREDVALLRAGLISERDRLIWARGEIVWDDPAAMREGTFEDSLQERLFNKIDSLQAAGRVAHRIAPASALIS